jgi:hypothetical protein
MSLFSEFLSELLYEGRVHLKERAFLSASNRPEVQGVLTRAFADYQLDVAGPCLPFAPATALAAAELVADACWFLVNHDKPEVELEKRLVMSGPPRSASEHLSADLLLRFLAQIHRRARRVNPADALTNSLAAVLRQWPLAGVLSDVEEPPLTPLDFEGHRGLLLLYAERLAQNNKHAWIPEGPGLEYVQMVWTTLGKDTSTLLSSSGLDNMVRERSDQGE